jgi:hypothetical protein
MRQGGNPGGLSPVSRNGVKPTHPAPWKVSSSNPGGRRIVKLCASQRRCRNESERQFWNMTGISTALTLDQPGRFAAWQDRASSR